ncbi:hypothetical protein H6504_04550 [Candidatus Woesearchaeota archaeon]|nr:hypothetical protein [Candidatus Woesearchaeota archaeon]
MNKAARTGTILLSLLAAACAPTRYDIRPTEQITSIDQIIMPFVTEQSYDHLLKPTNNRINERTIKKLQAFSTLYPASHIPATRVQAQALASSYDLTGPTTMHNLDTAIELNEQLLTQSLDEKSRKALQLDNKAYAASLDYVTQSLAGKVSPNVATTFQTSMKDERTRCTDDKGYHNHCFADEMQAMDAELNVLRANRLLELGNDPILAYRMATFSMEQHPRSYTVADALLTRAEAAAKLIAQVELEPRIMERTYRASTDPRTGQPTSFKDELIAQMQELTNPYNQARVKQYTAMLSSKQMATAHKGLVQALTFIRGNDLSTITDFYGSSDAAKHARAELGRY